MNLGNWLGQKPNLIQWYKYSGVSGGSLWILLTNIFLLEWWISLLQKNNKSILINSAAILFLILFPMGISFSLLPKTCGNNQEINALIIQPNINPYTEKYNTGLYQKQIDEQIQIAETNLDNSIRLLIFPETSLPLYLNRDSLDQNPVLNRLKKLSNQQKNLSVIAGIYTYRIINTDTLYYNSAVFINKNNKIILHDKSKLVPGVERTPFLHYLNIFKDVNVDFGGINASLNTSNEQSIFESGNLKIAPLICYESVFGTYSTDFVKKGANLIVVITNDAWWGNTPAYRQIMMHSQLRAIETNRQLIRVANTGISALINEKGKLIDSLPLNKKAVLKVKAKLIEENTFYVQHGDIIGRISIFTAIILLLASFVKNKAKMSNKF
jgi:apolipoprotein N-acyltransferase